MPEQFTEKPRDILQHTGTYSLDKALALRQVLSQFGLRFRVVASEGAPYPDGDARVPKGEEFVTYDTGNIPMKRIWRMVEEIAPTPMLDGRK